MDELKKSIEANDAAKAEAEKLAAEEAAKELETVEEAESSTEPEEVEKEADEKEETEEDKPTTGSDRLDKRLEVNLERMLKASVPQEHQEAEAYKPLDYTKVPEEGFSPAQLEEDRRNYAEYLAGKTAKVTNDAGEQRQFLTNLELDKDRVEARYPKLDVNSDDFDPVLADAVNKQYQAFVGFDPAKGRVSNTRLRYKDFVDTSMAIAERLAAEQGAVSAKNVAKQASRTGLRPTGGAAKSANKLDFSRISEMSDAEWEKNKAAYYKSVQDRL